MRIFMLVCLVSFASAQYNYGSEVGRGDATAGSNTDESLISSQSAQEEYNKVFYSFSAPEEEFNDPNAEKQLAKSVKRNLRVIFIKGPENTALEKAAVQLVKGAAEDHTAIYVLTKQSDIGSLASELQNLKTKNALKPEVHFIKYRTEADAETAQREIQAQYKNLPGTTNTNAPSSAPVINFASKATSSVAINNLAINTVSTTTAPSRSFSPPRNAYLPSNRRF